MMNRNNPKNIPLIIKLSLLIALLVIGGISTVSIFMLTKQNNLHNEQIIDIANAMALQLATSTTEPLFTEDMLSLQMLTTNFAKLPSVAAVIVADSNQNILAKRGKSVNKSTLNSALATLTNGLESSSKQHKHGVITVAAPISYQNVTGGYVYIQLKTNEAETAYQDNLIFILTVVGLVIILALVASYFISRYVSYPINQLLAATRRIGQGNFIVDTKERRNDELGRLMLAINEMGRGLLQKNQVESLLNNFLAKDVAEKMLQQLVTVQVSGEKVNATVLFVDIVGFTSMSEKLSPGEIADFLNEYFAYFSICARMYFGTIDKFIGDCAMVVFGAPKKDKHHVFNAVACAVLMQRLIKNINRKRQAQGKQDVLLSIGINSGDMLAGVLGTEHKMEYTVVGDSVNLASRLCGEAGPNQIIITAEIYAILAVDQKITAHPYQQLRLRGKQELVDTYIVDGVRRDYQQTMDALIDDVINNSNRQ